MHPTLSTSDRAFAARLRRDRAWNLALVAGQAVSAVVLHTATGWSWTRVLAVYVLAVFALAGVVDALALVISGRVRRRHAQQVVEWRALSEQRTEQLRTLHSCHPLDAAWTPPAAGSTSSSWDAPLLTAVDTPKDAA